MPSKRQRSSSNKAKEDNVKVRRVIIDSDEEDEPMAEQLSGSVTEENLKQIINNEDDEVVSEVFFK